mmetsp:Transcript_36219/g.100564  ORF Transcript_36219/g.100564 Transcript_36219/m.100564 type:complete len:276 (+) Transcript_36219:416-1243(+)
MDVKASRVALQAQEASTELVDVDDTRVVQIQQLEQHGCVLHGDLERLDIILEVWVRKEVVHLLEADRPRLVLVDLHEDLPHVTNQLCLGLPAFVDPQVLVVRRAGHGALNKHGRDHIKDAKGADGYVDQEHADKEHIHLLQHLHIHTPALPVGDSLVERDTGREHTPKALPKLPNVDWLVRAVHAAVQAQIVSHALHEEHGEAEHHEEEEQQRPQKRRDGSLKGVDHLAELVDIVQRAAEPEGPDHARQADDPDEPASHHHSFRAHEGSLHNVDH